jgi:hypothetical protein
LAIHIFRRTGWKHSLIEMLSDQQIDALEAVDPWSPRQSPNCQSVEGEIDAADLNPVVAAARRPALPEEAA